jgi:hypothetical protein
MYRCNPYCLSLLLCLPVAVIADPSGNWLQLHQMNQANRLKLERMQEAYTERQPPEATPGEREASQQLNRQQRLQQQFLQRNQVRERMLEDQRNRVNPSDRSQRLDGVFRQQRYRQAQEYQLQRFELQQRTRPRLR